MTKGELVESRTTGREDCTGGGVTGGEVEPPPHPPSTAIAPAMATALAPGATPCARRARADLALESTILSSAARARRSKSATGDGSVFVAARWKWARRRLPGEDRAPNPVYASQDTGMPRTFNSLIISIRIFYINELTVSCRTLRCQLIFLRCSRNLFMLKA